MLRINISWFIEVFVKIDEINSYISQPLATSYESAKESLETLLSNSALSKSFKASLAPGTELYNFIGVAIGKADSKSPTASVFGPIIQEEDVTFIKAKWSVVRSILLAELSVLPTYLIAQKGPYDTETLIHNGELLFPESLTVSLPQTLIDAKMAGRALVYEMPAACAFHLFRVLEVVVMEYVKSFPTTEPKCKGKTLGQKAKYLEDNKIGDEAIYVALRDLTKIHRNSIIHSKMSVSLNEAISLVGMTHGVINPMLSHIELNKPNTP